MTHYTKGIFSDRPEIIDLGNTVFNTNFKTLLPKLYADDKDTSACHFLAKEDGLLKAMVGSFPLELNVLDHKLKGFGIGTVCVHPEARGKGYMKQLMENAVTDMYANQGDFAILNGQKQRYEYSGFTPSGTKLCFTLTTTNLHHKGITANPSITFEAFDTLEPNVLAQIHALHHSKSLFSTRSLDDFIAICKSWESNPLAIYNEGELCGYMIRTGNRIEDFYMVNPDLLITILATLMQTLSYNECFICIGSHEQNFIPLLVSLCEYYQVQLATSLNILNYKNFITAFLELKNSYAPLESGEMVIEIKDKEKFLISVHETIKVIPTDLEPDISLSHLEAIRFLCDPLQLYCIPLPSKARLIKSWFPLPFSYCSIDNV